MKRFHRQNQSFFKECGRLGGLKRAKGLSASLRIQIASKAAQIRWKNPLSPSFSSVRLDDPRLHHPVFLEELLTEGSLEEWRSLYQEIANHPFGSTADALKKVLSSTKIYGVTPLWKGILGNVQGKN